MSNLKIAHSQGYNEEWVKINKDDFNNMHSMLKDIQESISSQDPMQQREFYQPLLYMITEAHMSLFYNQNNL